MKPLFTLKSAYAEYVRDLLFTCIHGEDWRNYQIPIEARRADGTVGMQYIAKNKEISDNAVIFIQSLICRSLVFDCIDLAVGEHLDPSNAAILSLPQELKQTNIQIGADAVEERKEEPQTNKAKMLGQ